MNFGIHNTKEKTYEMVLATKQDLIFELMVVEGKDCIILEENHTKICKNREGEIVSIFTMPKEFENPQVLFGLAKA